MEPPTQLLGEEGLSQFEPIVSDSAVVDSLVADLEAADLVGTDSVVSKSLVRDSLERGEQLRDTTLADEPRRAKAMLDDIMEGKNDDSLYYDVVAQRVFIYDNGAVSYQNKSLKADYMEIDMEKNEIYAYGRTDTLNNEIKVSKPEFIDGTSTYTMDTITYNLNSEKAKIKGVATKEGEGWLVGNHVKKMPDNSFNIMGGKYTTCEHTDHPHFYLAMTKAKVIPGQKVVTGPAYFVMEDVPLYFVGIPEGFFPITSGPKSGLLMPSYGEDATLGFYLSELGYYFTLSQHMDLALTGTIYSYGSWTINAASSYLKRYKYSGSFNLTYSSIKSGDKGESDYIKQMATRVQWSHSQDSKANPTSTFSASVNFATSGYSKYSATTLTDMLSTQTNSSISYTKSWDNVSLSTSLSASQNSQTEAISLTFPTAVVSVSRFYPFKSAKTVGADKWWEKISMTYTGKLTNSVSAEESTILSRETLDNMKHGIQHSIPVSASFTLFNYLNITPSFNYTERWYFKSVEQAWDPVNNEKVTLDPDYGFFRLYNYSASATASTTIYGMLQAKSKTNPVQAIRHTITPSVGFSYAPDFSNQKYGYYQTVQSDSLGTTTTYSPYSDNAYGVPSSGQSMAMTFSLSQTLAMKVLSKRDTTGVKKVSLIDQFSISGSYNFLADSMKLSTIPVSIRTTIANNFGINLSFTLDPYRVSPEGVKYDKLFFPGRIVSTSWSYAYTFKSRTDKSRPAINDITSVPPEYANPFYDPYAEMDPVLRRQYMAEAYYDFSIPWNFGFNYVISYSTSYVNNGTTGYQKSITQSVGFNGSVTLTPKMGLSFTGGYDIKNRSLTTSSISMTRDLHCWQMSFSWIPFGYYKSWSFNIGVKASSLADIKYDKSQSMYSNMY
ncbi:MAG: putative LPS assembly protein LptD [Rikenellaceae bacterium]